MLYQLNIHMLTSEELQRRLELNNNGYWEIPDNLDTSNFDFNWRPDPYDRPYIHQFGTQWQKTGGPRFVVSENEGIKYQSHQTAIRLPDPTSRNWRPIRANISMDYSWHPCDTDPPYIYVFGNQWYDVYTMPTIQYRVKGATEKKYITDITAKLDPCMDRWIVPEDIEDDFDYSWVPHPDEPPFKWQFGTQWQKNGGPIYVADNATVTKHTNVLHATKINDPEKRNWRPLKSNIDFDYSWHPDEDEPPYIYVFGNQHYNAEIMPTLLYRVKGATEKKYITDIHVTLLPNKDNWEIPEDIADDFDYSWVPDPNEPPFIWQFGTQHQKTGGPRYVCKDATSIKYSDIMKATRKPNLRKFRILENIDIENFDFSWHPDDTEEPYTYVFGNQYFTPEQMPTVIYHVRGAEIQKPITNRIAKLTNLPTVIYEDSIYDSVMTEMFDNKYVHLKPAHSNTILDLQKIFTDNNHRITILNGTEAVVHRESKNYLYDKLTDFPNINYQLEGVEPKLLDVIFFSNGEQCAEENYQHLLRLNLPNRIVRIDGVKGRVESQHAAANASDTPWYFLVNAKLKVNSNFDFTWQPNVLKSRRHYIFRATNPVNGLEYGHMAIVANNKKLTLSTKVRGLDFTMDSLHEVVDINSGVAMYNSSPWDTWRTAFRECIKLCNASDIESKNRLSIWKTGTGMNSEYSIRGAIDAENYYNSVNGSMPELMKTYNWAWIEGYYLQLYPR